jgi:hypothetical protein
MEIKGYKNSFILKKLTSLNYKSFKFSAAFKKPGLTLDPDSTKNLDPDLDFK